MTYADLIEAMRHAALLIAQINSAPGYEDRVWSVDLLDYERAYLARCTDPDEEVE